MATQELMDKSITAFRSTAFQLKLVVNLVRLASATTDVEKGLATLGLTQPDLIDK